MVRDRLVTSGFILMVELHGEKMVWDISGGSVQGTNNKIKCSEAVRCGGTGDSLIHREKRQHLIALTQASQTCGTMANYFKAIFTPPPLVGFKGRVCCWITCSSSLSVHIAVFCVLMYIKL